MSQFTNSNSNLSRAATAVLNAQRRDAATDDDLRAFSAPSECWSLVEWSDLDEVVQPFGFMDLSAFERECTERGVTGHWLHFRLGL